MSSRTFQFPLLLLLLVAAGVVSRADDAAFSNVAVDGPHSCGGVEVPYPFGIIDQHGTGDFREGFGVACQDGKSVLNTTTFTIGNFSIHKAEARIWLPVTWKCFNSTGYVAAASSHEDPQFPVNSVYRHSNAKNHFFVVGCNTVGYLRGKLRPDPSLLATPTAPSTPRSPAASPIATTIRPR